MLTFRPTQAALALVAAVAAFTCVSCACCRDGGKDAGPAPADSRPAAAAAGADAGGASAADAYPMIVRLVGRHQTITVTAGPAGPLYSATRSDGTAVVAGATLETLRRDHPDVYQHLVPSIATERDRDGSPGKPDAHPSRREAQPVSDASLGALMLMSAE